jgi:hypothetical protein
VTVGDDECVLRLLPSDHFPSEHGALSYLHAALNCTMCSVHATCWSRTMRQCIVRSRSKTSKGITGVATKLC